MGDTINFDYYYGIEAEQFSFYRVPRLLIKDERLLWSSVFVTLVAKKDLGSYALTRAS